MQRLLELDISGYPRAAKFVSSTEDALLPPEAPSNVCHLKLGPDNHCVFFGEDNLCEIHKLEGPGVKPQVCHDFPYRWRDTPSGSYVGLSFVCPAVRGNLGASVEQQRQALTDNQARAFNRAAIQSEVQLSRRIRLTWNQYLAVEESLFEILALPDPHRLAQKLITAHIWLNMIDLYWQSLHGPFPPAADANLFTDSELFAFIEASRQSQWRDARRVASRRAASPLVKRMFLGLITALGNTLWQGSGRASVVGGIMFQYARHASKLGKVRLQPMNAPVSHSDLARTPLPEPGSRADELVTRYVRHCIFRKDLVDRFAVWKSFSFLLLNVALIPWVALSCAAARGAGQPSDQDYSEAVRWVEQNYGCHSKFYPLLAQQPRLDDVIESFFLRKNYPFVLLQEV